MATIIFLLVAGALLLLLEPVIPQLVAGSLGLVCWAGAVLLTYLQFGVTTGTWTLAGTLAVAVGGTWWYLKRLPTSRVGRLFQSHHVTPTETGAKIHLLNRSGTTVTPLRPGGMAEIAGERVDVVTSGEPVERGQNVTVISVEGSRILVRVA